MLVAQVAVNPHRERAPIAVAQPTRNSRDVHARFNAPRREQMPQIMVRDSWDAEQSASSRHGLLTFANAANGVFRGMPLVCEAFQQRPHIGNDWNVARRGRAIGLSVLGVVDNDKSALKIHVYPSDLAGLGKPASREGE